MHDPDSEVRQGPQVRLRLFLFQESYDGFPDWNKMGWLQDS